MMLTNFDGSSKLVKLASQNTGINVANALFEEFTSNKKFDGIWTCASLLHVKKKKLVSVMNNLANSLKPNGIWYVSFKYGTTERENDGRFSLI